MSKEQKQPSDKPEAPSAPQGGDEATNLGLIKLRTWVEMTFSDKPSMGTVRRWARTGAISPQPQLHGRDYFVLPTAVHMQRRRGPAKQSGVGLLEFVLALTLSLVLAASVLALYRVSSNSEKVRDEASRLMTLADKIEDAFVSSTGNYASLATNGNLFIVGNIGLQSVFTINGTTLTGVYAPVTIGVTTDGPSGLANSAYSISYAASSLSSDTCINLVNAAAQRFRVIKIGTYVAKAATATSPDPAIVTDACVLSGQVSFIGYNS